MTDTYSFSFSSLPKLYFGPNTIKELPNIPLFSVATTILFITGASSFPSSKSFLHLMEMCDFYKKQVFHEVVSSEPSPSIVDSIRDCYKNRNIHLVIGIGGGSVLDTSKAVSAMLLKSDSVTQYLEGIGTKEHNGEKIPLIAIPTTSGTGSEATKNAVLSEVGLHGFKKSLRHDNFIPNVAIIDPTLMLHCPTLITASSGLDGLTQLIGSYISTKASPMTDSLALHGMECVRDSLLLLCTTHPEDIHLRSKMAYASWISGITLANAGLSTVHGFASSIGGRFSIPHGTLCGILLYETTKASILHLQKKKNTLALQKFATIGEIMTGEKGTTEEKLNALLIYLKELQEKLHMPTLSEFNVTENDLMEIASITSNKNNPAQLSVEELYAILHTCFV